MVAHVVDGGAEAVLGGQGDAEDHVADVADQGERQDSFDIGLRDRAEDAHDHREQAGDQQDVVHRPVGEHQGVEADDRVDADLGEQSREDGGDGRGGGGVRVGQPVGQGEHGGLDAERHQEHGEDGVPQPVRDLGQPYRELGEVEGAGGRVGQPDAQEEHHRRHHGDDGVRDAGADAFLARSQREQDVGRGQEDLEADEEVEQVAGDEGGGQSRRQGQVGG